MTEEEVKGTGTDNPGFSLNATEKTIESNSVVRLSFVPNFEASVSSGDGQPDEAEPVLEGIDVVSGRYTLDGAEEMPRTSEPCILPELSWEIETVPIYANPVGIDG